MKAPEKVYIDIEHGRWYQTNPGKNIEYTRTDTFIKITCEWIKSMWSETDDRFKEDYTGMLIDNFKNYIKGG